jgi:hypothetical protein
VVAGTPVPGVPIMMRRAGLMGTSEESWWASAS